MLNNRREIDSIGLFRSGKATRTKLQGHANSKRGTLLDRDKDLKRSLDGEGEEKVNAA